MPWINDNSYKLIDTEIAVKFAKKNNLSMNGDDFVANFFNEHILIRAYEERNYLHFDYYDLDNHRWARELQTEVLIENIPSLECRKELMSTYFDDDDVLSGKMMQRFSYTLTGIDNYMQDFLKGDFSKYNDILISLNENQKCKIDKFKVKFLKN